MILKVLENRQETKNSFTLILEKPEGFIFYPGQFLDIELPVDDPFGTTRIFSISSSPSEDFIMLTYKRGTTPFKKKLELLKKGDIISSSHPAGTVVIDDSSPIVMLAGGIGIAPHRSMIKWAVDQRLDLPITLIYSNSDDDFIFIRLSPYMDSLMAFLKRLNTTEMQIVFMKYDGVMKVMKMMEEGAQQLGKELGLR